MFYKEFLRHLCMITHICHMGLAIQNLTFSLKASSFTVFSMLVSYVGLNHF